MRRVVGLVAMLLVAAPVGVAAASPSPTLDLSVLGTTLAGAPDPGWVEQIPRNNILQGQFDAARYVDVGWTEQSVRDTIRNRLLGDGFIGGYGRSFYKKSLDGWIVEDVAAFPDASRARSFWAWSKDYFHDPDNSSTVVDTPTIPDSFGDAYTGDQNWHGIDIRFPKATYVFTVTAGSYSAQMPALAKAQAIAVYDYAPSYNVLPASASLVAARGSMLGPAIAVLEVVALVAGLICVVGMLALVVLSARRRRPQPQTSVSPDGNYWWDGAGWQSMSRP